MSSDHEFYVRITTVTFDDLVGHLAEILCLPIPEVELRIDDLYAGLFHRLVSRPDLLRALLTEAPLEVPAPPGPPPPEGGEREEP